ncbi:RNA-directed DNA polymerase [Mesorhizobium calcicola]|uniref:RNA-directed DNA polymerase n=1 Tax=Mesorhizobium calcicola TaxID=1300310 RepID=A0ABW4WES5_9HYPH
MHDKKTAVVKLLLQIYGDFDKSFVQNPSNDIRSLVAVHHSGFRWASQLDPLWNAFLLGNVLSIAEAIEKARLGPDRIFSYRLNKDSYLSGELFRRDVSWKDFIASSLAECQSDQYVVTCDIADCYSRVSHHKLDNALRMIGSQPVVRKIILEYMKYLTGTRSAGLPIGGPAARILAELALANSEDYLFSSGIKFFRYADDYHIFCNSKKEAHEIIVKIYKALDNEGLSLQKSKTRILTSSEFRNVLSQIKGDDKELRSPIQRLMSLTLRFDPYAPNSAEQYEELKDELEGIDVVALLNEQLSQTRVHIPSTRKIVEALRLVSVNAKYGAILPMLDNMEALYPIAPTVFQTIYQVIDELGEREKEGICARLIELYDSGHEVMALDMHVAYSNRIVGKCNTISNRGYLHRCFDRELSELVRRDIIMIFANWGNFSWLSVFKASFGAISGWQRRALILASYSMVDEGSHWRDHMKSRFDAFEMIVRDWRSEKPNAPLAI